MDGKELKMGDLNFDKRAAAIAALHSSDMKRSICHEQVVQAMRDAKNTGIELCDRDHCTPEERAVVDAAIAWRTDKYGIGGVETDDVVLTERPLAMSIDALLTTRKEQVGTGAE